VNLGSYPFVLGPYMQVRDGSRIEAFCRHKEMHDLLGDALYMSTSPKYCCGWPMPRCSSPIFSFQSSCRQSSCGRMPSISLRYTLICLRTITKLPNVRNTYNESMLEPKTVYYFGSIIIDVIIDRISKSSPSPTKSINPYDYALQVLQARAQTVPNREDEPMCPRGCSMPQPLVYFEVRPGIMPFVAPLEWHAIPREMRRACSLQLIKCATSTFRTSAGIASEGYVSDRGTRV
jgi:hypothetical protein